jgi:hypothetical protein
LSSRGALAVVVESLLVGLSGGDLARSLGLDGGDNLVATALLECSRKGCLALTLALECLLDGLFATGSGDGPGVLCLGGAEGGLALGGSDLALLSLEGGGSFGCLTTALDRAEVGDSGALLGLKVSHGDRLGGLLVLNEGVTVERHGDE